MKINHIYLMPAIWFFLFPLNSFSDPIYACPPLSQVTVDIYHGKANAVGWTGVSAIPLAHVKDWESVTRFVSYIDKGSSGKDCIYQTNQSYPMIVLHSTSLDASIHLYSRWMGPVPQGGCLTTLDFSGSLCYFSASPISNIADKS